MSFRKNSILFYENVILLAALSLLMIAVGLVKNFPILCLCAVPLLIVALVSPKLDREYITIDEWGITCKEGDQLRWSFDWAYIADLRRSSRFRLPSIEVIPYDASGQPEPFASDRHYFQLGRAREKGAVHVLCQTALSANIEQDFFHSPALSSSRRSISAERSKSICRMSSMGILTPLRMITSRWYSSIFPILPVSVRYAPPSFRWSGLK